MSDRRPETGDRRPGRRGTGAALALALAAVILSGCQSPPADRIDQVEQPADSADHVMTEVKTIMTSGGVRQANLEADSAFVYENSGRQSVKKVRLTFFTPEGVQQSVLTADSGWYEVRNGSMEARGNVVVVRADGSRLTTSKLLYEPEKNQVSTDQPYTYTEGERRVQGNGFVSDPSFRNITTQAVRGTGGRYTLPGQ